MNPYRSITIPLEAQYLYRRGLQMVDQRKEEVALVYFRQAVFIAPGFSKAYQELGNSLERLGRPEEAAMYRAKASRICPPDTVAGYDTGMPAGAAECGIIPGRFLAGLVW